jgi:hypothetical protein
MLRGEQGVDEAVETFAAGDGCSGLWGQMPWLGAGELELALEIGKGEKLAP